jgi:hypothetical protein
VNVFEEISKSKKGFMATTKVGTAPMKAAQIPKAGADFQIVERDFPPEEIAFAMRQFLAELPAD